MRVELARALADSARFAGSVSGYPSVEASARDQARRSCGSSSSARAGADVEALGQGGADPGGLAEDRAGRHHPGAAEGDVAGADVPPGHPQVRHVAGVQAAQGDVVVPVGVPVAGAALGGVHPADGVEVDGPAAEGDPVLELGLAEHVVLGEHVVADEAAVLALAGHGADPLQGEVLRVEAAGVLDVVPDAVADGLQLVADPLVVSHDVEIAAPFDPPVVAAVHLLADHPVLGDRGGGDVDREGRGHEALRVADVLGVEEDRRAEHVLARQLRCPGLAELGAGLAAAPRGRAGEVADEPVAAAVDERPGLEAEPTLGAAHPPGHRAQRALAVRAVGLDLGDVGVQEQGDVLLGPHLLQQQQVPVVGVPVGVAVLVLHEQLAHDPGLAGEHVDAVRGRAAHPHPHLAGGVPAEHGPVLGEGDAAALPGGGDRRADPREAASHDHDVGADGLCAHRAVIPSRWWGGASRRGGALVRDRSRMSRRRRSGWWGPRSASARPAATGSWWTGRR